MNDVSFVMAVRGLKVSYELHEAILTAVDGVDLDIREGELLAIVGESGCGKSTLALSMIGLLPRPPAHVVAGSIVYQGRDLLKLEGKEMERYRGTEIAMIFQDPMTSLNPVHRIGEQIVEAIVIRAARTLVAEGRSAAISQAMVEALQGHRRFDNVASNWSHPKQSLSVQVRSEAVDALRSVQIRDPEQVLDRYPFELSGGMSQRVMLAMALVQRPKLIVADEPTSSLDVTTQAEVLKLLKRLIKTGTSILLITHDLAVASQVADRVVVMYGGQLVEEADVFSLFSEPLHPYTKGLLACIPKGSKDETTLTPIPGTMPDMTNPPEGCRYVSRCPFAMDNCRKQQPPLVEVKPNHKVACYLHVK